MSVADVTGQYTGDETDLQYYEAFHQRPFAIIQAEDIPQMEEVFAEWLAERAMAAWSTK